MLRARKSPPTMDFAIPAINVVFLLLLFFITSGSQSNRAELSVAPPSAELLPGNRLPRPLLTISKTGELFLDGAVLDEPQLRAIIAERRRTDPSAFPILNILADRDLPAREVLGLMDRLRRGQNLVSRLVTQRPPAGPAASPGR